MPWHTASFDAIGVENRVTALDRATLREALEVVRAEVHAIDLACSRFRDDAELARLNRSGGRPFAASPLLVEALEVALRAAAATRGRVDPTVGASVRALGWDRDFPLVVARNGERTRFRVVPAAGWRSVQLDAERGAVRIPHGVELDLGATAKAFAADRAAKAAAAATGEPVLVSLGGDVSVAGAPRGGWPVRVVEDHRGAADAPGETVTVSTGGLATSTTTVRRWRAGGASLHHLVDPKTGAPADGPWRTVTVAASTCVGANAAATAAIVRGAGALDWLRSLRLDARLVAFDGTVTTTGDWPVAA
jgi:thiamine biosynthesis lipoprotein